MQSAARLEGKRRKAFLATAIAGNEAVARCCPESRAEFRQVAGGYALFNGEKDPATRAIEIGSDGGVTEGQLDELERFFRERNTEVRIVISNDVTATDLIRRLGGRGYSRTATLCTYWRSLPPSAFPPLPEDVLITPVGPDQLEIWARTVATGFREQGSPLHEGDLESWEVCHFCARCSAEEFVPFLATRSGEPSGGGLLQVEGGVALLRSASVRFRHRGNGVQRALIAERLKVASEAGCDLVFTMADKGGASERNLRRFGFMLLQEGCCMSK